MCEDRYGDLEATEDLIAVRKDLEQRDPEQRTPLHYAIAYGHPDIMQELLDAGADTTAVVQSHPGPSPAGHAASHAAACTAALQCHQETGYVASVSASPG